MINALTFNMCWKLKNIEMVINASAVLDMLGPFQCSRNDISPTRKSLKICNYSTVRLLPLLFRCGWLKRLAEIEIKRMEGREGGRQRGRKGGGRGERCWQLPKPSCLSRCQSNCCTLTTAQIREPGYQTASAISSSHKTLRPQSGHEQFTNHCQTALGDF